MAIVFRARDVESGRVVALKVLRALKPSHLDAFRREIRSLSRIRHPGLVALVDDGVEEGLPYYTMEIVEGTTLRAFVHDDVAQAKTVIVASNLGAAVSDNGPPSVVPRSVRAGVATSLAASLLVVERLADTLAFLHGHDVVHRDLKPDNVIVRPDGSPVLVDFGLVSRFRGALSEEVLEARGEVAGTLSYMAPEQIRGEYVDARADLYALGAMLYELVTGRVPFTGTATAVVRAHLFDEPDPPSHRAAGIAPDLDALIMELLSKDPRSRPGSAADVALRLRQMRGVEGADSRRGQAPVALYRPSFCGRKAVLAALEAGLRGALRKTGGLLLVTGPSGVGKTRLALEAASSARTLSMRVVTSECAPIQGRPAAADAVEAAPLDPFRPLFRAMVEHAVALGPEHAARIFGRRGKVLAAYEPTILALPGLSDWPDPPVLSPVAARARLIGDAVHSISEYFVTSATLFIIDDVMWADDLSVALLTSLSASLNQGRGLLMALARAEELPAALLALSGAPGVAHWDLESLQADEIDQVVRDILAWPTPPKELLQHVAEVSGGNALFISEYLRRLVQTGAIVRDERGGLRVTVDLHEQASPQALADLLSERLHGLSSSAAALVAAGAVLGRIFPTEDASALGGLSEAEEASALSELIAARVLEDIGDKKFRFSHDKLREAAYVALSPKQALVLHARALERLRDCPSPSYANLANHAMQAGHTESAVTYADTAADEALSRGAHGDARRLYSLAFAWEGGAPKGDRLAGARRLRKLAEASFGLADLDACREHSMACMRSLGVAVPTRPSGFVLRALRDGAFHLTAPRAPEKGLDPSERARLTELSLVAGLLASTFYFTGENAPLVAMLLLGTRAAERIGSEALASASYARLGYVLGLMGFEKAAVHHFQKAHRARAPGNDAERALCLYLEAFHHLGTAAWRRSRDLAMEAASILDTLGDHQDGEIARTIAAHALFYAGQVDEAEAEYAAIIRSARVRGNAQHHGWGLLFTARSKLARGDAKGALPELLEARRLIANLSDRLTIVIGEGLYAEALWEAGDYEQAVRVARAILPRLSGTPLPLAPCLHGYAGAARVLLSRWEAGDRAVREDALLATARLSSFAALFPMAVPESLRALSRVLRMTGARRASLKVDALGQRAAERRGMPSRS